MMREGHHETGQLEIILSLQIIYSVESVRRNTGLWNSGTDYILSGILAWRNGGTAELVVVDVDWLQQDDELVTVEVEGT